MSVIADPGVRAFLREGTRTGKPSLYAERTEEPKRSGVPGELVVRLRPAKVVAAFGMTG
ncbi:hypothetical protein [Trebonia sp.]|uniref:hypothetical protein n=1 Tax=Trebonia sp. TaxID=2767075 RepID=UPI002635760E|nr:hypothetical protein [Trebonia sp.]